MQKLKNFFLEGWEKAEHESVRRASKGSVACYPGNFLKIVSLMPFLVFWSEILCMVQVANEEKIFAKLMKQDLNSKISDSLIFLIKLGGEVGARPNLLLVPYA